jgi:hypothetical protein
MSDSYFRIKDQVERVFIIENAKFSGFMDEHGFQGWTFEFDIMNAEDMFVLAGLKLGATQKPEQLPGSSYQADSETEDLMRHSIQVEGKLQYLLAIHFEVQEWNTATGELFVHGEGLIGADMEASLPFEFKALCEWSGLVAEVLSEEEATAAVSQLWETPPENLEYTCERSLHGVTCIFKAKSG